MHAYDFMCYVKKHISWLFFPLKKLNGTETDDDSKTDFPSYTVTKSATTPSRYPVNVYSGW